VVYAGCASRSPPAGLSWFLKASRLLVSRVNAGPARDGWLIGPHRSEKHQSFMKLSHKLSTLFLSTLLAACGGGGGDDPAPTAAPSPAAPLAAFEGVWRAKPGMECLPGFDYNPAYFFALREAVVRVDRGALEVVFATLVYGDAACTVKQGLITETLDLNMVPTTVAGREGVYRSEPVLTAVTTGADGGAGLTLLSPPDGELTGLPRRKVLVDVDGSRLYVTADDDAVALDAVGYPTQMLPDKYLVR